MPVKKPDLSIVILSFNTKDLLNNLLLSIKESRLKNFTLETIVVDNASSDGTQRMLKEKFKWVKLITSQKNLGYAAGNNLGIKTANGRYLLLLNSDTKVLPETFIKMIEFMDENPEVAATTARIELPSGELDKACHRGFPTPWAALTYFSGLETLFPRSKIFSQYHQGWKDLNRTHRIDSPSGAFFIVRREVVEKVGLLDERFFMYAEDLDWAYRIKKKGYKIFYYPHTKIIHYKKQSGRKRGEGKKITQKEKEVREKSKNYFFETMKLFYDKHYKNKYPWVLRQLVLVGIWIVSRFKN